MRVSTGDIGLPAGTPAARERPPRLRAGYRITLELYRGAGFHNPHPLEEEATNRLQAPAAASAQIVDKAIRRTLCVAWSPGGGIGRRAGFRYQWCKPWRFESSPGHSSAVVPSFGPHRPNYVPLAQYVQ